MKISTLLIVIALVTALFFFMQRHSYEGIIHIKASKFKIEVPIEPTILYREKEIYDYIFSE